MIKLVAAALAGLILALGASPAFAGDVPTDPVPTEPTPVPAPEPISDVDVVQPLTAVRVLPTRCTGIGNSMPVVARACRITSYRHRPAVVVWGDSHSWQQTPAIIAQARRTRTNLVTFQMGACPPMLVDGRSACAQMGRRAIELVQDKARRHQRVTVVLGGAWALYRGINAGTIAGTPYLAQQAGLSRAGIPRALRALDRLRVRTVGIAQMPMMSATEDRVIAIPDELATAAWLHSKVDLVVDTTRHVCSTTTCFDTVGTTRSMLDALHINPAIAPMFTHDYAPVFNR